MSLSSFGRSLASRAGVAAAVVSVLLLARCGVAATIGGGARSPATGAAVEGAALRLQGQLAGSVQMGCFRRHLEEAIQLNEGRLPLYAKASNGASTRISKRLIELEKVSTLGARYFDWRAKSYQEAGIPLLCEDFVSMSAAPAFGLEARPPAPRPLAGWNAGAAGSEIRDQAGACKSAAGFQELVHKVDGWLAGIDRQPEYDCMTRHILDSIRRAAGLAPVYDAQARAKGMASTLEISWQFIWVQSWTLEQARELDQWAAPLQEKGIPILCRDVPPIPPVGQGN